MLDVDAFKTVNDTYGHKAGDAVLRQVANIIGTKVGVRDIYGRYGGDEFIIGVVNSDVDMVMHCAEKIQQVISNADMQIEEGKNIRVTVSSGVRVMNGEQNISELVYRADQGLYLAKAAGKNCVLFLDTMGMSNVGTYNDKYWRAVIIWLFGLLLRDTIWP